MSEFLEESAWDKWKREQENSNGALEFEPFNVATYKFTHGGKEYTVDVCGPYKDGSWTIEPSWGDDIHLANTDELIDFMLKYKIKPPPAAHERKR